MKKIILAILLLGGSFAAHADTKETFTSSDFQYEVTGKDEVAIINYVGSPTPYTSSTEKRWY